MLGLLLPLETIAPKRGISTALAAIAQPGNPWSHSGKYAGDPANVAIGAPRFAARVSTPGISQGTRPTT